MATARLDRGLEPGRLTAASLAVGAVAGCALVAAIDPNDPGGLPACPSRALLGFDCPACGTARGLHALTRGRIGDALDHNLLLLVGVPAVLVLWWRWVRTATGHPARRWSAPAWVLPAVLTVVMAFTLARNVDVVGLRWLASSA